MAGIAGAWILVTACTHENRPQEEAQEAPQGEHPHECVAEEGSVLDVADEPDWRQFADFRRGPIVTAAYCESMWWPSVLARNTAVWRTREY
jgi:hypothetical protein